MNLKVVLEPSDEDGYTIYVPSLPGCISDGETREEALSNIREAIELYLEPVEDDIVYAESAESGRFCNHFHLLLSVYFSHKGT